jgi:GNAT superfamily N-acetyltransferase
VLNLAGYPVKRLTSADAAELQELHERCADYFTLIDGAPTRPTSAAEDLAELPPGKTLADKFVFGIHDPDGTLVGAVELARDLPGEGQWWVALLLLAPELRGRGLGTRVLEAVREWVVAMGGRELQLAVLEQNTAAERFWQSRGFREIRCSSFTAATGLVSRAIIMSRPCEIDLRLTRDEIVGFVREGRRGFEPRRD